MNTYRKEQGADGNGAGQSASDAHHTISVRLRQFYESVQEEGIPDRFMELLERLDAAEKKAGPLAGGKDRDQ